MSLLHWGVKINKKVSGKMKFVVRFQMEPIFIVKISNKMEDHTTAETWHTELVSLIFVSSQFGSNLNITVFTQTINPTKMKIYIVSNTWHLLGPCYSYFTKGRNINFNSNMHICHFMKYEIFSLYFTSVIFMMQLWNLKVSWKLHEWEVTM